MSGSGYSGSHPRPIPPGARPAPVKITKPDGSTHVTSAQDFKKRPDEGQPDVRTMSPDQAVTMDMLEQMAIQTFYTAMRDADTISARTAAANGASRLIIAGKYKLGPEFGAELDGD